MNSSKSRGERRTREEEKRRGEEERRRGEEESSFSAAFLSFSSCFCSAILFSRDSCFLFEMLRDSFNVLLGWCGFYSLVFTAYVV